MRIRTVGLRRGIPGGAPYIVLLVAALVILSGAGPKRSGVTKAGNQGQAGAGMTEGTKNGTSGGSASTDKGLSNDEIDSLSEGPDSLEKSATEILEEIIGGLSEGDYNRYISSFSRKLKKAQNRETFLVVQRRIQKRLGKLVSSDYLGSYVQAGETMVLFKARFDKDKDDVLIRLVLDIKKTRPEVTGIWFDTPALSR